MSTLWIFIGFTCQGWMPSSDPCSPTVHDPLILPSLRQRLIFQVHFLLYWLPCFLCFTNFYPSFYKKWRHPSRFYIFLPSFGFLSWWCQLIKLLKRTQTLPSPMSIRVKWRFPCIDFSRNCRKCSFDKYLNIWVWLSGDSSALFLSLAFLIPDDSNPWHAGI